MLHLRLEGNGSDVCAGDLQLIGGTSQRSAARAQRVETMQVTYRTNPCEIQTRDVTCNEILRDPLLFGDFQIK